MKILSLDLATRTGWAFWNGSRIESGVQDFAKLRGESNGMIFVKFNRWLDFMRYERLIGTSIPNFGTERTIDLIVYEQAHHRGGGPTEIGVGLTTRVAEMGARHGIEYTPVHTATLKKFATGKGNAEKAQMVLAANAVPLPGLHKIVDDNEADAICLLWYGLVTFGGTAWNAQPAAAGSIG